MQKFHWMSMVFVGLVLSFSLGMLAMAEGHHEESNGICFSLVDEEGEVLMQTANTVHPGDLYITAQNTRYLVEKIEERTAICRYDGEEEMPDLRIKSETTVAGVWTASEKGKMPAIAIYHTHDDESYVPSDGQESIRGDGGIYDVGKALKDELETMGFKVFYSEAKHDPHDVNAYNRSRETAAGLLREGSDVLIDVHRDAVPPENYETEIDGESATKVKLVVGKSNPNQQGNMEFAKTLKAAMDEEEPGLSAGIYEGKGDYNQDLTPRAILIEVGAHTNSKEEAEKGVKAFAQSLPLAFGVQVQKEENESSADLNYQSSGDDQAEVQAKPLENTDAESGGGGLWIMLLIAVGVAGVCYFASRSRSE